MELKKIHGRIIDSVVTEALTECNSGKAIETWEDWRRVGAKIGIRRIEFHDRDVIPEPMLRYDDLTYGAAVLYLPYPRSRRQLYFWLLHEYAEVIQQRDLAPPFHYPSAWGDHHAMAQVVERHHQKPLGSLNSLDEAGLFSEQFLERDDQV